jgi:hypothetical protein
MCSDNRTGIELYGVSPSTVVGWLIGCVLLTALSGFGQAAYDPWLILSTGDKGSINSHTTRQDLVQIYGASNVVDQDVDVGEGETEPGTVVFPKDPQRSIEILWKDLEKKAEPRSVTISGSRSRWHAVHGISLGTSLKELERLNGRPFKLAGFGWDYSGTVTSWEKGALAAELDGGDGRVILRLDSPTPEAVDKDVAQVQGDRDFSSDHPVMQKLNPTCYQVIWVFRSPTQN